MFDNMSRHKIKAKIIKDKIFDYECEICGLSEWNENYISLHLDHINGINNDNRLENLRFLCPNCHSQTETYCGNSNKKVKHYSKKNKKVSDEELLDAIRRSNSIKEALDFVGMSGANNYDRVKKLADKNGLTHIF